jgi:hypothetical protein
MPSSLLLPTVCTQGERTDLGLKHTRLNRKHALHTLQWPMAFAVPHCVTPSLCVRMCSTRALAENSNCTARDLILEDREWSCCARWEWGRAGITDRLPVGQAWYHWLRRGRWRQSCMHTAERVNAAAHVMSTQTTTATNVCGHVRVFVQHACALCCSSCVRTQRGGLECVRTYYLLSC